MPFLEAKQFVILEYQADDDLENQAEKPKYIKFTSQKKGFDTFIRQLYTVRKLIVNSKTTGRVVHLHIPYEAQCNWEFSPKIIDIISKLDLTLTMSCEMVEVS
jgi:hypothetical protein